jgi:uncharacterized protein (TIGR03083 family)
VSGEPWGEGYRAIDPAAGLAHLTTGIGAIRRVLADGDLDAAVPACPDWTVRELAWHLGDIQRWVHAAIVEGHPNTQTPPGPADREPLLAWYDEGAGRLVELLARTDPEQPCWTFGPKPSQAGFWFRRQAHEHAVHAYDAQASQGRVQPIVADLAADGIDEVASMFFPRQVRLHRIEPLTRSLVVRPDDAAPGPATGAAAGGWVLAGDGTSSTVPAEPDAVVRGPAEALYLLLWRRITPADPRVALDGDPDAARAVLAAAIVP